MPLTVFISSKLKLLKTERDTAEVIIKSHKFLASRCEHWGASARHNEDTCRKKIRESDVVVFILGRQFSPMVAIEFDEARKRKKPCLVLVKHMTNRDGRLQLLISDMKPHVVFKEYSNLSGFKKYLDLSISDLIEERITFEKERAIIQEARLKCDSMNDKILKAKLAQPTQVFQTDPLSTLKVELFSEKREIEKIMDKILGEGYE